MADYPRKEYLLRALKVNLEKVTIANGYWNDVAEVDRDRGIEREELYPVFFINEVEETLEYKPGGVLRSKWMYNVLCGIQAETDESCSEEINKFVADFVRVFFADQNLSTALLDASVELPAALVASNFHALEHYIRRLRYDEGYFAPSAVCIATCELTYNMLVGSAY